MKFAVHAALGFALMLSAPVHAATPPAAPASAPAAAHVKAVQDLLAAMQVENTLRGVAARSRYPSEAQRKEVFAKLDKVTPAEVHRRLAPALVPVISLDTATEMTRFYNTPYGKKLIHDKFNSSAQVAMPGMQTAIPAEEKKERKRAAYVQASKELAAAEALIEREAFKLLQLINKEKR